MSSNVSILLKNKRKELGLSVNTVLNELSSHGIDIAAKTLYGWEGGSRQPDADTFLVLCQIYGINSFGEIKKTPSISDEAMKLAKDYDVLDKWGKAQLRSVANNELKRVEAAVPQDETVIDLHILKIAGRDGSFREVHLTDEQVQELQAQIDQLPDAPDSL